MCYNLHNLINLINERFFIMEWTKLRQDEFKDAVEKSNKVCIIPIGCIESHGIHLPLGCDVFHGRYIAAKAAEKAEVCVFPELFCGEKSGAGERNGLRCCRRSWLPVP